MFPPPRRRSVCAPRARLAAIRHHPLTGLSSTDVGLCPAALLSVPESRFSWRRSRRQIGMCPDLFTF
jgi:hypothetical protein